jgi:KamA family protein
MSWRDELREAISSIEEIREFLNLSKEEESHIEKVVKEHPMRITKYYLSLIDRNDSEDQIRKMIVPDEDELDLDGSYDTSGEKENTKTEGLQHKYDQTALILATNQCAAYCRHCFRKRLVGLTKDEILRQLDDAVDYITEHPEINNVLISGGDPFVLPTSMLTNFLERLSTISHIDFIRFGTRVPVVFPDRILSDSELLRMLRKYSTENRRIYIITHFNHPKEITEKAVAAIDKLIKSGVIINNQTVLLGGINDDPDVLSDLLSRLVSVGINPYYVFQCRPVKRVKRHFQVPLYKGYRIVEETKKRLNGLSKRFKYVLSHRTGKIEIVGVMGDEIYFKYHQAKNPEDTGKFFKMRLDKNAGWLDDLELDSSA